MLKMFEVLHVQGFPDASIMQRENALSIDYDQCDTGYCFKAKISEIEEFLIRDLK